MSEKLNSQTAGGNRRVAGFICHCECDCCTWQVQNFGATCVMCLDGIHGVEGVAA